MRPKLKALFLGVDGATWNILNPLIKKAKLPNFSHIIQQGFSAKTRSLKPLGSPMLWTSINTGKIPDKQVLKIFMLHLKVLGAKEFGILFRIMVIV